MNLVTEPWIPLMWLTGETRLSSLHEALARADQIGDLVVQPYERIALLRLLICIAQAALHGPQDHREWSQMLNTIQSASLQYLAQWQEAFNLFTGDHPFLQATTLELPFRKNKKGEERSTPASKLNLRLATSRTSTLWDTAGGTRREFTPAELALMLLTYQNCSPCGTIGVAFWNGQPTLGWKDPPKSAVGYSAHAPCVSANMLHAFVRGRSLLETIRWNMVTKEVVEQIYGPKTWGRPLWEMMPNSPVDSAAMQNATRTYLGRLVPFSRAIQLHENGRAIVLANGLAYPEYPEWREPSASIVTRVIQGERISHLLSASSERAVWRELHSALVSHRALPAQEGEGPLALRCLPEDQPFDLWTGGLICNKSKLVDVVESTYHMSGQLLQPAQRRIYEAGILYAEELAERLHRANYVYHLESGDPIRQSDMTMRRQGLRANVELRYWSECQKRVPYLLATMAAMPQSPHDWAMTPWGRQIYEITCQIYKYLCPLSTGRQARAHVAGLRVLCSTPFDRLFHE